MADSCLSVVVYVVVYEYVLHDCGVVLYTMSTMTSGASYVELMVLPEAIPSSSISVRMSKYLQTKIIVNVIASFVGYLVQVCHDMCLSCKILLHGR